ncbi:hypothetical protein K8O96_12190 [Clostridium sporogenes]|uniref:Uncharacterized protein n=1 Tax=Clostridium botulinum TaxID=1491 RepID=A0A6M0SV90_CLOBO|nr:hypothetical protein [Clostridium sporogenes]NFA59449.1 hypothetical protein [Clostridium botulinum]NFI74633.1 hypothetical protein [Clostridium sporogenes]NFL71232.1 hypothetical protein [Clostridium sporogenes]NFM25395.1 hypothetical protein [Clostridium sporogenes]NFP62505.1 hypothetical protein [Clostridium sporogenes]
MNITNVLKDHGVGIGGVDEFKEFKLLRSVTATASNLSGYGDFDDNVAILFKEDFDNKRTLMSKFNVLTDNTFTQVNTLNELRLHNKPRFSNKYLFALLRRFDSTKTGYLYVFTKDGSRIVKQITLHLEISPYSLKRVLDDPITGNIAVIYSWNELNYVVIYDSNLNVVKDEFSMISDAPKLDQGTFFYNSYIYGVNSYDLVKYDYRTNTNVKNIKLDYSITSLITNQNTKRIFSPGMNKIYDFDLNEIVDSNGHYRFSSPGTMNISNSLPLIDGAAIFANSYNFGFEYKLEKDKLNARVMTEVPQTSSMVSHYVTRDLKTLVCVLNNTFIVYTR